MVKTGYQTLNQVSEVSHSSCAKLLRIKFVSLRRVLNMATKGASAHELSPCLGCEEESIETKMWGQQRRVALDVLMACWGLGTWLGVNGLYVQLPLLVERLPEGWALPTSIALAVQLANVGMLAYVVCRRLMPRSSESLYICGLLAVGTLSLLLNSFLYTRTTYVGSTDRSVAFITLTFFAALVGCTSSVLFYPYLRHYRDVYLTTYLVGEGLSGLIPGILALIQGVGGDPECVKTEDGGWQPVYMPPRFSSTVFMLLLAALSGVSLISFVTLHWGKSFASERVTPDAAAKNEEATSELVSLLQPRWLSVLLLMACLNFLSNGALPSIQSYSCMPYGAMAYHLAVTLGAIANPAACLTGVWVKPAAPRLLAALLVLALPPLGYMLATALMSPAPPLLNSAGGVFLVVISWVLVAGVTSYARMWVYGWCRAGGARGMRACGLVTQLSSALGSLVFFALVNYAKLFTQPNVCPDVM